jgi:drug/metabolite transporter (DMT)-like permease
MMETTTLPRDDRRWLPFVALLGGNVALALGPWSVRLADSGPVSAGFWRLALALPFLLLLAWRAGERPFAIPWKTVVAVAAAGVFFSADLASWHLGISMTRLGNATLFGNAGSLILMVWGFLALHRLPRTREWAALATALAGVAILMGRSLEVSTETLIGDLLCLAAGVFYAFYLIPLQRARVTLGPLGLLAWSSVAGLPLLAITAHVLGEPFWPQWWTPLVVLALLSQVIGQGLLVYALGHFRPLTIGLVLLTQPAIAALYGWLVFDERLGALDVVGMVLLAGALVLARAAGESTAPKSADRPSE